MDDVFVQIPLVVLLQSKFQPKTIKCNQQKS